MDFELSEQQELLQSSIVRHADERAGAPCNDGLESWPFLAETGFLALPFAEARGGLGAPIGDALVAAEAIGFTLLATPYLEIVGIAGGLLQQSDSPDAEILLRKLVAGEALPVPVIRHANDSPIVFSGKGDNPYLNGEQRFVPYAAIATHFVVETDGPVVVLPADTSGISLRTYKSVDGRPAAALSFQHVRLDASALTLTAEDAPAALAVVAASARASISAELVGCMRALHGKTIAYVQQRKQFGRAIADFQVIKHRLADAYVDYEQCKSLLVACAMSGATNSSALAAKYFIAERAIKLGHEAIQLHGGMGVTAELDIAHYHTRIRVLAEYLGAGAECLQRYADSNKPAETFQV